MSHDTNLPAHWAAGELYRGFIAEAERLEARGYDIDTLADACIALGCHLHEQRHGPAEVGIRLRRLANLFIGEAERKAPGAGGVGH